MVAGEKHRGHLPALPDLRPGVLGIFEKPVPVAFADIALGVRQDARNQTADRITDGHGGDFAAGEDKVAQRELFIHAGLKKALVHPLIVAADQNKAVVIALQTAGGLLPEGGPLRCHGDHAGFLPRNLTPGQHRLDTAFERLGHHDAAEASAVGIVVHLVLAVFGIVADLNAVQIQQALPAGAAQYAFMQHAVHIVRKKCKNVDTHYMPPMRRTVISPAAGSQERTNAGTAGIRCSLPPASVTT